MLPAGGSCLLGSINLSAFVDSSGNFDFDALTETAFDATVALNDVLDEGLPLHPLQEQRDCVRDWRQIGLGIFGLADMFIKMGVTYGSEDSIVLCDHIARIILNTAALASASLASTKGAFPMYDYDALKQSPFYQQNIEDNVKNAIAQYGLRNSQLLTIAPTGSLSSMLGCSGGIEPIFARKYTRKTESLHGEDRYYEVYQPIVKACMDANHITDESQLPEYIITSAEINPIDRVMMQSVWQQYIDASISSTVNLPEEATVDEVADIYINAYRYGLKGITVFRSGCRRAAILTAPSTPSESDKPQEESHPPMLPRGFIMDASDNLVGKKRKLMTGCGSLHCTAFFDPDTGELMETYLSRGSTGGCANSYTGLSRMISLAARAGAGIDAIADQLDSCGICPSYAVRRATKHDTSPGACCPVAIGKALKEMWTEMQREVNDEDDLVEVNGVIDKTNVNVVAPKSTVTLPVQTSTSATCPECGEPLIHEGGCQICRSCGWSKCE